MTLKTYMLGTLGTNCYLLSHEGHAMVIDPAEDGAALAAILGKDGLTLDAICLTHCHYDHVGGAAALQEETGAPVYLHPADLSIVPALSMGRLTVKTEAYPHGFSLAGEPVTVYHTPGHSPGSVCLLTGNFLFSGDTLFAGSCGRTDLEGGSWDAMRKSLCFLSSLDETLRVLPGHGESSTLKQETQWNPYLREAMQK